MLLYGVVEHSLKLPWIPISDNATRTSRCLDVVVTCAVPHAVVTDFACSKVIGETHSDCSKLH